MVKDRTTRKSAVAKKKKAFSKLLRGFFRRVHELHDGSPWEGGRGPQELNNQIKVVIKYIFMSLSREPFIIVKFSRYQQVLHFTDASLPVNDDPPKRFLAPSFRA